jgi:hypothetical protein
MPAPVVTIFALDCEEQSSLSLFMEEHERSHRRMTQGVRSGLSR